MAQRTSGSDDAIGNLRTTPFPELLDNIGERQGTGKLQILVGENRRELIFQVGRLVRLDGADIPRSDEDDWVSDAVLELCSLREAAYRFLREEAPRREGTAQNEPGLSSDEVLARANQRVAAWRDITAVVPSTRAVPRLTPRLPAGPALEVNERDWEVIAAIGGDRTAGDLMVVLERRGFDVLETLARLTRRGAVQIEYKP